MGLGSCSLRPGGWGSRRLIPGIWDAPADEASGKAGKRWVLLQTPPCRGGRRAGGFGELGPSIFSQRRPCPSGIHHPTASTSVSIVLLSTAVAHQPPPPSQQSPSVTVQRLPAPRFPGVPLGAHPPILSSLPRSFFLQSLVPAWGKGGGSVSIMAGPVHADLPSHGEEHPQPSPEQLHIPPRALGKGGER